jgi:hypothetical protein
MRRYKEFEEEEEGRAPSTGARARRPWRRRANASSSWPYLGEKEDEHVRTGRRRSRRSWRRTLSANGAAVAELNAGGREQRRAVACTPPSLLLRWRASARTRRGAGDSGDEGGDSARPGGDQGEPEATRGGFDGAWTPRGERGLPRWPARRESEREKEAAVRTRAEPLRCAGARAGRRGPLRSTGRKGGGGLLALKFDFPFYFPEKFK